MIVAVRADVLPLAGGEREDRPALGEVLRGEKLLRQDRRAPADGVEDALADADAARVLPEDAHQRLERELRGELRVGARAVAVVRRPQRVRMLKLELVARP